MLKSFVVVEREKTFITRQDCQLEEDSDLAALYSLMLDFTEKKRNFTVKDSERKLQAQDKI